MRSRCRNIIEGRRSTFWTQLFDSIAHFKASLRALILLQNQEDAQTLTLRVPMVFVVAGIFGYFSSAVCALVLVLLFLLLRIPETCDRWEATGLHGEDADPPGRQHPQSDQSPQRQLPFLATGPVDHQRRLAGLSEVLKGFATTLMCIRVHLSNVRWLLLLVTHRATFSEFQYGPVRFFRPVRRANSRAIAPIS